MANIIGKHQQSASLLEFVKARQLADNETRFCIDHVKFKSQDGRDRWFIDIHYREGEEILYRTLTLDSSPSRDEMFQDIIDSDDYPQHNVWLKLRSFKDKDTGMTRTSYDVKQGSGICACSTPGAKEAPADLANAPY